MTNALTPIDAASTALAQAETADEFRAVRDAATAAKAWVRARGLGIDEENKATTVILRAERGAGAELIRMSEAGVRARGGAAGRRPDGSVIPVQETGKVTLDDLGIRGRDAMDWQNAARIPEDQFESMIQLAIESGTRLAKVNFYRPDPSTKAPSGTPTKEDGGFVLFRESVYLMLGWTVDKDGVGHPTKNGLLQLPIDEIQKIGELMQHMIRAYTEARAAR